MCCPLPLWFRESASPGHRLEWKIKRTLYSGKSKFQTIEFVETEDFGTALLLDGIMQTTTGDEFIYHEMLACVPLAAHPNPERILIIGGGDGGLASTVLQDNRVREVTMVELDEEVVRLSNLYLPQHTRTLDDSRMSIYYDDGAVFVQNCEDEAYDIVLVDSTDPDTSGGQTLYTPAFHRNVHRILKPSGIYAQHSGTPFYNPEVVSSVYRDVSSIFPDCHVYWTSIPTYPGGCFTFTAGAKGAQLDWPLCTTFRFQHAGTRLNCIVQHSSCHGRLQTWYRSSTVFWHEPLWAVPGAARFACRLVTFV